MIRIGILGSDNSHAISFSKLINLPDENTGKYRFENIRVTHLFGLEEERTKEVATLGAIETIVAQPEEMLGAVDAVIVVFRHGDLHYEYALPFVAAGIPTWIDKPFTISTDETKQLIRLAEEKDSILMGGSTCRYAADITQFREAAETEQPIGKITSAVMSFSIDLDSIYGGFYFYGSHLIEMMLGTFGYEPKSVIASCVGGSITAVVKYDDLQVTLQFVPKLKTNAVILYGENGIITKNVDISGCYGAAMDKFINVLRGQEKPPEDYILLRPVELMNAIMQSVETRTEVVL